MVKKIERVVLDSNILISAIVFGGKPLDVLSMILNESIDGIISRHLLAELSDVLSKNFSIHSTEIDLIQEEIEDVFEIVQPKKSIHVVRDDSDNKVIEAAVEGNCDYIITGDKDLLSLGIYKGIKIITASEFLNKDILSLAGKFKPKKKKSILKAREELERKYKRF